MYENGQFPFKRSLVYMWYKRQDYAKEALNEIFREGIDFIPYRFEPGRQDGKMQRTAGGKFAEENI